MMTALEWEKTEQVWEEEEKEEEEEGEGEEEEDEEDEEGVFSNLKPNCVQHLLPCFRHC